MANLALWLEGYARQSQSVMVQSIEEGGKFMISNNAMRRIVLTSMGGTSRFRSTYIVVASFTPELQMVGGMMTREIDYGHA